MNVVYYRWIRRGRSPVPYLRFFFGLLDLLSRFVLTIRQMAVTIASSASERSLIISLTDSFICFPPFYDLIIARIYVLVKHNRQIQQNFSKASVNLAGAILLRER